MKGTIFIAIVATLLLAVAGCTPAQLTGMAVKDAGVNNGSAPPAKYTVPDDPSDGHSSSAGDLNTTQICQTQINELKEKKTQDEYNLLQLKGQQQKLSMEIQFKKGNPQLKDEVEKKTDELSDISKKGADLKSDISSKKSAIRLLEEKCRLAKPHVFP